MYENYTYEQIKSLPDDQKTEVLKELLTIYPINKDLANHLDVTPIVTSNLIKKYVEGIQVGRKAMTPEEKAQKKLEREAEKKLKEQQENESQTKLNEEIKNETNEEIKPELQPQQKANSFSIQLDKNMIGEEAIARLSGISNSLLKDKEYKIGLVIEEV